MEIIYSYASPPPNGWCQKFMIVMLAETDDMLKRHKLGIGVTKAMNDFIVITGIKMDKEAVKGMLL